MRQELELKQWRDIGIEVVEGGVDEAIIRADTEVGNQTVTEVEGGAEAER